MHEELRGKILDAYSAHLQIENGPSHKKETELPYKKEIIRQALIEEIVAADDESLLEALGSCFLLLENYVCDEDFAVLQKFDAAIASRQKLLSTSGEAHQATLRDITQSVEAGSKVLTKVTGQIQVRMQQLKELTRK